MILKNKDYHACLLLGGNLNDVKATFVRALSEIRGFASIEQVSAIYRTKAWEMGDDAPDFLNQAVVICADLEPKQMLQKLQSVESRLGRIRGANVEGYESRTIDIDIILIDDLQIKSEDLVVPHPRMHLRKFVLVPMAEVVKHWRHPVLGKTVSALLREVKDDAEVVKV